MPGRQADRAEHSKRFASFLLLPEMKIQKGREALFAWQMCGRVMCVEVFARRSGCVFVTVFVAETKKILADPAQIQAVFSHMGYLPVKAAKRRMVRWHTATARASEVSSDQLAFLTLSRRCTIKATCSFSARPVPTRDFFTRVGS